MAPRTRHEPRLMPGEMNWVHQAFDEIRSKLSYGLNPSDGRIGREAALVMTKLDEAEMWAFQALRVTPDARLPLDASTAVDSPEAK